MVKNKNNNQPSPGDHAEIKQDRVHMVTYFLNLEGLTLRSELRRIIDQRDDIAEEWEDLNVRFEQLKAVNEHLENMNRKQREKLQKNEKDLMQMERLRELATMSEGIFMGELDKTGLDYLRRLYEVRAEGLHIERISVIKSGDYSMDGDFLKQ